MISNSFFDIYCFYIDGVLFFIKWRQDVFFDSIRKLFLFCDKLLFTKLSVFYLNTLSNI